MKPTAVEKNDITYPTVNVIASMAPYRQFNKVQITDPSIFLKAQTRSLPVQVIDRAEILNSGKQIMGGLTNV